MYEGRREMRGMAELALAKMVGMATKGRPAQRMISPA